MKKTYIIVGLTYREADHHWQELAEVRPELRDRSRVIRTPIEQASIRGVLRGRRPDLTEVIVMPRAWQHRRAHLFERELRYFNLRGEG